MSTAQPHREEPAPRLRSVVEPFAEDLAEAVENADDLAQEDAFRIWLAIAEGDPIPDGPAQRVRERARGHR